MIKIFVPNFSDARNHVLQDAIDAAEYNLGVPIVIFPMSYRASWCLAKGNLAEELVSRLHNNGFDKESLTIFMLRKDIRTSNTNFCFGVTIGKTILLSDHHVWFTESTHAEKVAMLAYLIEHELGHAFGVADDFRASGIFDRHCTNEDCVMQQVTSLPDLKEKARTVFLTHAEPGCYCGHCQRRYLASR